MMQATIVIVFLRSRVSVATNPLEGLFERDSPCSVVWAWKQPAAKSIENKSLEAEIEENVGGLEVRK